MKVRVSRWLLAGAGALLVLAGCAYSARTEMSVLQVDPGRALHEAEALAGDLVRHHDGCFSARNATMTKQVSGDGVSYDFLVRDHGIQLRLTVSALTGEIALALDEWSETRYSQDGAACYRQVVRALQTRYPGERLTILERCKGACVR